jgi:ABC-type arginine transport system ATPase subunit
LASSYQIKVGEEVELAIMDNHKEVYLAHFYIVKHGQMDILEEPMGKQVKGH